jgi:phosphomannomutase
MHRARMRPGQRVGAARRLGDPPEFEYYAAGHIRVAGGIPRVTVNDSIQAIRDYFRFCPGEEHVRISDAVCRGRRRSNFPKCRGCQFNDEEQKSGASSAPAAAALVDRATEAAEKQKRDQIESVFKAYDIRGVYPEPLDAEMAWRIGQSVAQFLRSELRGYDRSLPEKSTIVVGRDMRKSSPELASALIDGLRAGGSPVIDIGMVDTPQLYFAVNHFTCCGGVQVTASHNPSQYNGFKICGLRGRPVGAETGLSKICKIAKNTLKVSTPQVGPARQEDLTAPYRDFVRGFLTRNGAKYTAERPLRIVVDASNGMAGRAFPLVFNDIEWIDVIRLNFDHNGDFVHDPNPLVDKNLTQARDRVMRSRAHMGICFDGDADRCVFVDNNGQVVRSDLMTALLARQFLRDSVGSTVVYDLRCSRVVPEEIRKAGGSPRRERCGHSYIKKALSDSKGVFAGELSGHYYFRDNWFCDSGLIAVAHVINLLTETGKTLADLIAPLQRYCHSGERNFENPDPERTIKLLSQRYAGGDIDYLDGITVQFDEWWFNVRPSNTEPLLRLNLEARTDIMMADRLAELVPLLGKPVTG